ncbi:MAG: flagellar biosynthesis protein FlhF [Phycisphaerae bacterium]|nr:flagellar biosynthesis protein FlhF [Phycisphaerae bacterium]
MKLKTYQADSMADALAQVRRELGRDAVILNTRTVKKGGLLGLGARRVVEITAGAGVNVLPPGVRKTVLAGRTDEAVPASPAVAAPAMPPAASSDAVQLKQEIEAVKQMVRELVDQQRRSQTPNVPEELFSMYLGLVNQEVAQELADGIARQVHDELTSEQLRDEGLVRAAISRCVEKMIPDPEPITAGQPGKPRVIAFVGPTGVGKTTTIAKLAANFRLRENRSVALITIDTYRIAAVDQLRTYANIINIPLRVVLSPDELRSAIESFKQQHHLILIDTAGRSQNDRIKLQELKSFLDAASPDEVHLVLSSTSSHATLQASINQFSPLGIHKVVFTKLDEAVGVGMLLNVVRKLDRSISYLTTGQNVPDDIELGSGKRLAKLILDQCTEFGSPGGSGEPLTPQAQT